MGKLLLQESVANSCGLVISYHDPNGKSFKSHLNKLELRKTAVNDHLVANCRREMKLQVTQLELAAQWKISGKQSRNFACKSRLHFTVVFIRTGELEKWPFDGIATKNYVCAQHKMTLNAERRKKTKSINLRNRRLFL
jgi:hypothetical protein